MNKYFFIFLCLAVIINVTTANSVCKLPMVEGGETERCRADIPKFYYDAVTGLCKRFFYSGCGGNGNNFNTEKECQETCQK